MALTPLTQEQYEAFIGEDADLDSYNDGYFAALAQQSADLFYFATKLTEDPTDAVLVRMEQNAMAQMIEFLINPPGGRVPVPFQSEQIGSYVYKMARNIQQGMPTGLLWWDLAMDHFNADADFQTTTSTIVFDLDDHLLWEDSTGQQYVFGPVEKAKFLNIPPPVGEWSQSWTD